MDVPEEVQPGWHTPIEELVQGQVPAGMSADVGVEDAWGLSLPLPFHLSAIALHVSLHVYAYVYVCMCIGRRMRVNACMYTWMCNRTNMYLCIGVRVDFMCSSIHQPMPHACK